MYQYYNPNPVKRASVGDCAVRAISKVLGISWYEAFDLLAETARRMGDIQNSNVVINEVLEEHGFHRETFPYCRGCYTVKDFAKNNPYGRYVLGTGSHVVAVIDGDFYDAWRSDDESVMYFWVK